MKKLTALLSTLCIACSLVGCSNQAPVEEVKPTETPVVEEVEKDPYVARVATLKGPTGMGMAYMMSDDSMKESYDINIINAIDEIAPSIVKGDVDIASVPANMASVLYNNTEGDVEVLAINTLGVLYIVEKGEAIQSVEDLKGKTIYASGKGATPEYVLNYILEGNGIDPVNDVNIEYKSEHAECVGALMQQDGGIAMLPQPFVTVAQTKSEDIRTALDLTKEWDEINKDSQLITGCVIARKDFIEAHPTVVDTFLKDYKTSIEFTNNNIDEAAKFIDENGIVKEAIAKKAIPFCNITYIDGEEMKTDLNGYYNVLFEANPKSVGGKIPDDNFYYIQK